MRGKSLQPGLVAIDLLIEEGEEVAHNDENWSGDGQEDLTDVERSLI